MTRAPDWVNAIVATLLFLGASAGLYIGLSNQMAVVSTQVEGTFKQYDAKLSDLDTYQSYLQQQIDKNKDDNTRLKTQMEYSEKSQERLANGFDALAAELRKTNDFLIKLSVEQSALNGEKKNGGK